MSVSPGESDDAQAIEVVALFEDTVLDVQHLRVPTAARARDRTLIYVGAGALLGAASLFAALVCGARGGRVTDGVALLLIGGGLAALAAGLERRARARAPSCFTVGETVQASFCTADHRLPLHPFPLVQREAGQWRVSVAEAMTGDVVLGGAPSTLAELRALGRTRPGAAGIDSFPISDGAKIRIDLGKNRFLVSSVTAPLRFPHSIRIDWRQESYTAATALVLAIFLFGLYLVPPDPKSLALDRFDRDRIVYFLNKPPAEEAPVPPLTGAGGGTTHPAARGRAHAGPPGLRGKAGRRDAPGSDGQLKVKGSSPDPQLARQAAEEAAQHAGIIGLLRTREGTHVGSIFGRDSALGPDSESVLASLVGTVPGESQGSDGLGPYGPGRGGGGTGEATIGVGAIGTWGTGPAGRVGYRPGLARLERRPPRTEIVGPPPVVHVVGSLDKSIIRRVIRSHLNEVRFCYEKELMKSAALSGRVTTRFTISATGQVIASGVEASTLANPAVESCVAAAVRRWEFPRPEGGVVVVSYPFVLKAAGAE